ncbi:MAG: hypothetical protein SO124_01360, partial [Oscillospiraceae bacterium]|nr:hypothetical protein [Oscillospiraceae bacterium]
MPDEYISREAALTALQDSDLFNTTERQLRAIRELSAADVAEVVRCKDCIYRIEGRCFSRTSFLNAPAVEPDN